MNVPLMAHPMFHNGKEKMIVWYNGKHKIINTNIRPYFYSYDKLNFPADIETVEAIALSSYKKKKFYKYSFNSRQELLEHRREGTTFEDNILYLIRNRIDIPDLFTKFPHTNELKFLFLDIEQYTEPNAMFPTYDDRIISIAYCTNDRKIKCIYLKKDTKSDKLLLEKFVEEYQKIDPDVIIVYNKTYDIPTILQRCMKNRIGTYKFSKTKKKPYISNKNIVGIEGVVIYDVYDSAREDQSLTGNVENHGLKAVSDYFGFKSSREPLEPREISKYVGTQDLIEYNRDDVKRLLSLFDIYWQSIVFNANDLAIPLNLALDLSITKLGLIVLGDEYRERNIIADGTNHDRYPEIFQRQKKTGEPNYQGALVDISQTGLYKPTYKADYGSMYPTIMSEFNFSPDTTTLLMFEPYGKFRIKEENHAFIYYIPDNVLNKTMVIQVLKEPGFIALLVRRFLKERAEYKRLWKQTGNKRYETISNNRKVKANGGVYGIQGSPSHPFGFAPMAIATTGIGRECAGLLINILNKLYPKSVIEWDTDGVYFSTEHFEEDKVLNIFNEKLGEKFKKDLDLTIDIDKYDAGYFYKAKNYLLKKGDKTIYHGAAMKARNKDNLSKNLIQELAEAKLEGKSIMDIMKKYQTLDFPLNDFAMSVTLGMPLYQYKNANALAPRLARMAEKELGIKPQPLNQYHYVKERDDYRLLEVASKPKLDKEYYLKEIERIMKMFDAAPIIESIDKWL